MNDTLENDKLCDRCFACAHQILETYEIETYFKDENGFITYIKKLLDIIKDGYYVEGPTVKINNLNYPFLNSKCEDCINYYNIISNKFIIYYIKTEMLLRVFDLLCINNEYNKDVFDNAIIYNILQKKLLSIHYNKRGNYHMIKYYHQYLIKDDIGITNLSFKNLDKMNYYYEKFFKIPIYLANFDAEQYQKRSLLNLKDKIYCHPLTLDGFAVEQWNKIQKECI